MNILDLAYKYGLNPKKVTGNEYHSPCPWCGGRDRFIIKLNENGGTFWCRQCKKSGGTIKFLMEYDKKTSKEACEILGLQQQHYFKPRSANDIKPIGLQENKFIPREIKPPGHIWRASAVSFIQYTAKQLLDNPEQLEYLNSRGISKDTAIKFSLGYNPEASYRDAARWGQEEGKIYMPIGIVIPIIRNNIPYGITIRKDEGGYHHIKGSVTTPMVFGNNIEYIIIVESYLDAIMLSQEAGELITAIAIGGAQTKPDTGIMLLLNNAAQIQVALDCSTEEKKETAGPTAWLWWKKNFPQAIRRLAVEGKDPGDDFKKGVSIKAWVVAELPEHIQEQYITEPVPEDKNKTYYHYKVGDKELISDIFVYTDDNIPELPKSKLNDIEEELEKGIYDKECNIVRWKGCKNAYLQPDEYKLFETTALDNYNKIIRNINNTPWKERAKRVQQGYNEFIKTDVPLLATYCAINEILDRRF